MKMIKTALSAALVLAAGVTGFAHAALVTIPQSALTPITQLYTDGIGGGIGAVAVMTGGGNANGAGVASGRNDDGFMGPVDLGFTLNFFGGTYTQFYANNNGNISFTGGNSSYIPSGPIGAAIPTISAWFGDVDTRSSLSGVMHIRQDITDELIVTWDHVGYFGAHGDLLNTFQMIVRSSDYAIPLGEGAIGFFWLDMPWEVTDTSRTAAVGFGNGAGDAVVLEGTNAAGLNRAVDRRSTWFNQDLTPVCGVPGAPACPTPEPGSLPLVGLALVAVWGLRRRMNKA